MLSEMFNTLFPTIKKETKTMANSTQYVVYTRNFKSRAKQIGVFAEPASQYQHTLYPSVADAVCRRGEGETSGASDPLLFRHLGIGSE